MQSYLHNLKNDLLEDFEKIVWVQQLWLQKGNKLVSMKLQFANIAFLESCRVEILLLTGLGSWRCLSHSII